MKYKHLNSDTSRYTDESGEYMEESQLFSISRQAARLLRKSRAYRIALIESLQRRDRIREYGCDCSHCRNDWDCCGSLFLYNVELKVGKRTVRVIEQLTYNV